MTKAGVLIKRAALLILLVAAASLTLDAQQQLTAADYGRAERFMNYNTTPLVLHSAGRATWVGDPAGERFWYRTTTEKGSEAFIVNVDGTKTPCDLPACRASANEGGRGGGATPRLDVRSPDGKRTAFVREWNLWVRDVATGRETQLTKDGIRDFGYATDNAGWTRSDRPILVWSPDSKKIATFQQDQRRVGEMYLVDTSVGHPALQAWKYPLPGDDTVTMIHRVVVDADSGKITRFQMPADQHRSTLCDDLACRGGEWGDVQWSPDGSNVAFVSTARDHRHEQLRVADAATGSIRDVLEEKAETFFESGNGAINWRYLPGSNEAIWFSERDNWGHLYLYDAKSGREKHPITSGDWNVTQVVRVDERNRLLYFVGVGHERGRDPYFRHLYRIGMDGRNLQLLTPDDGDHDVSMSPSGRYFVDTFSKPDVAPVTQLRDASGALV
ncbi:MAG TPA: DPP IV N-terminal domain-containing protein, partial [Vicinamibacterales bacterium]|nr:DPP IV N-terminal domain-containing protein [Vicinamibacterales bacterium]